MAGSSPAMGILRPQSGVQDRSVPVNKGARPVLPPGGHSTQCAPPPVPEERAAAPADVAPARPPPEPPEPLDPLPLADDPDAALPELVVPLPVPVAAMAPVAVVAFPEAG